MKLVYLYSTIKMMHGPINFKKNWLHVSDILCTLNTLGITNTKKWTYSGLSQQRRKGRYRTIYKKKLIFFQTKQDWGDNGSSTIQVSLASVRAS